MAAGVFDLHPDGALYFRSGNGSSQLIDSGVQAIARNDDLSVFDLHVNGQLLLENSNGTSRNLDSGVQMIAGRAGGSVFDLHSNGNLYLQDAVGSRSYLDGWVQTIAGTGGSSVFDLNVNTRLYLQDADGSRRYLDNGVEMIAGTGGCGVFDLHSSGYLYLQKADGTYTTLDNGAQTLVGTGGLSVLDLHTTGSLYLQNADGTYKTLDNSVEMIAGTGGLSAFDLHNDGSLYLVTSVPNSYRYLDCGVQTIAGTGGLSVFDLHTDGRLYLQTSLANPGCSWWYLDGNVIVIAGTGGLSAFDLHSDGRLYLQTSQANLRWYLDGGLQTIFGTGGLSVYDLHCGGALYVQPSLVGSGWRVNSVDRNTMLNLFYRVEDDGIVRVDEFGGLQTIVALVPMPDYVHNLAGKVVNGDPANIFCNSAYSTTGNLFVGAPAQALANLVSQWFLGTGPLCTTDPTITFSSASGTLFGSGGVPLYTDVYEGDLGDCTLMAGLAEVALRRPDIIQNMFIVNGDGTYTVRFYHNQVADYVTVNTMLPGGGQVYDHVFNGVLWAALAEKAVVEVNESGWLATCSPKSNCYSAIDHGNSGTAVAYLSAVTGLPAGSYIIYPTNIASAWQKGKLVILCSGNASYKNLVEHNHCYAMVGYDSSSSTPFTLFNPWGIAGGVDHAGNYYLGQVSLSKGDVSKYFACYESAGAALQLSPPTNSTVPTSVAPTLAVTAARASSQDAEPSAAGKAAIAATPGAQLQACLAVDALLAASGDDGVIEPADYLEIDWILHDGNGPFSSVKGPWVKKV